MSVRTTTLQPLLDGETHEDRLKKIDAERAHWLAELESVRPETRLRPLSIDLPMSQSAPQLHARSPLHIEAPAAAPAGGPSPSRSALRRLGTRAILGQRAAKALSHPPPNLERQASDTWGETLPAPVARAAERFDEAQRRSRRQARLAIRATKDDPASPRAAVDFELYLSELFWARYSLDAPVEHQVEAYPDAVWGVGLDRIGNSTAGGDTRKRPDYAGIAFTGSPEAGKTPVRPKLPALRNAAQRPTTYTLLPDSHFALGAFGNDGALAFKRKEEEVIEVIWTLDESIFRARKWGPVGACDSNDFWDRDEVRRKAFLKDWGTTTGYLAATGAGGRAFGTTKLSQKQIGEIRDLLGASYESLLKCVHACRPRFACWRASRCDCPICVRLPPCDCPTRLLSLTLPLPPRVRIFTYYACIDAATTLSIYGLSNIGYRMMCRDAGLIGGEGDEDPEMMKVLDLTWIAVNESMVSKGQDYNAKGRLTRWELIEWAVRMAFEKYAVVDGALSANGDVLVGAVRSFLGNEIASAALKTSALFCDANEYRTANAYHEKMDGVLRKNEATLRAIFESYAFGIGNMHDKLNKVDVMVYEEWLQFIGHTLDWGPEVGDRKVAQCFAWARMLVVDEHSVAGRAKQLRLTFEDFLEAMIRLCELKALPTDEELKKAEHTDAGEYIKTMRTERPPEAYEAWVTAAQLAISSGTVDPLPRRMHHMIRMLIALVQDTVSVLGKKSARAILPKAGDGLMREEVDLFQKRGGAKPVVSNVVKVDDAKAADGTGEAPPGSPPKSPGSASGSPPKSPGSRPIST